LSLATDAAILARRWSWLVAPNPSVFTYWYFHLPNFVLAALMYTLLGRVLLGLFFEPSSKNYIWRFFVRITDPVVALVAMVTPKATPPVIVWLFGFVWLFWLRVAFDYAIRLSGAMSGIG
jgi:YggT family protein